MGLISSPTIYALIFTLIDVAVLIIQTLGNLSYYRLPNHKRSHG